MIRRLVARLLIAGAVITGAGASALAEAARSEDVLARQALVALAANDRQGMARAHEAAAASAPGLAEAILYLFNSTLSSRDEFLLAMETAARQTQDKALRDRMLLALLEDEYYELNQLKGENRYNKFTRVFNRASSSLSRLAMLQPQAAAQLLLDGAYSLRKARATTDRERQMAFLCRVFLEKYPDAPEAGEVAELQAQLRERLRNDMLERERLAGDLYRARGNLSAAEFHYENAALLAPDNKDLSRLVESVRTERRQHEESAAAAVAVAPTEGQLSREDLEVLGQAARALLTGRAEPLARAAQTPSGVTDSVGYAAAAWFEMQGRHDAAIQQLVFTAESFRGTPGGQAAAALLADTSYNLDERFELAMETLKTQRKQFILTGKRSTEDQGYVWGSAAIQSGGQGLAGLPALFLTDVLVRGVAEHFKTQVETDLVVDAGARYIRRYPGGARSREIAGQLAQLCEKAGDPDRAGRFLALAGGGTPDKDRKLDEDRARRLMDQAMAADDLWQRKRLLQYVVETFGSTKIAATARKQLARLHPTLGEGSVVLTRKMLRENPGFAAQLGIPPSLLDGRKAGGEMAELGVAFDPQGRKFAYQAEGGDFVTVTVPEPERERLMAGARALADAMGVRESGRSALKRQIVPVEIKGGAGGSGIELAPQLIPYADRPEDTKYFR